MLCMCVHACSWPGSQGCVACLCVRNGYVIAMVGICWAPVGLGACALPPMQTPRGPRGGSAFCMDTPAHSLAREPFLEYPKANLMDAAALFAIVRCPQTASTITIMCGISRYLLSSCIPQVALPLASDAEEAPLRAGWGTPAAGAGVVARLQPGRTSRAHSQQATYFAQVRLRTRCVLWASRVGKGTGEEFGVV